MKIFHKGLSIYSFKKGDILQRVLPSKKGDTSFMLNSGYKIQLLEFRKNKIIYRIIVSELEVISANISFNLEDIKKEWEYNWIKVN